LSAQTIAAANISINTFAIPNNFKIKFFCVRTQAYKCFKIVKNATFDQTLLKQISKKYGHYKIQFTFASLTGGRWTDGPRRPPSTVS
jgi:hypothetical protein